MYNCQNKLFIYDIQKNLFGLRDGLNIKEADLPIITMATILQNKRPLLRTYLKKLIKRIKNTLSKNYQNIVKNAKPSKDLKDLVAKIEIIGDSIVKKEYISSIFKVKKNQNIESRLVIDRFVSSVITANNPYGSYLETIAPDNDPLDMILLSSKDSPYLKKKLNLIKTPLKRLNNLYWKLKNGDFLVSRVLFKEHNNSDLLFYSSIREELETEKTTSFIRAIPLFYMVLVDQAENDQKVFSVIKESLAWSTIVRSDKKETVKWLTFEVLKSILNCSRKNIEFKKWTDSFFDLDLISDSSQIKDLFKASKTRYQLGLSS